MIIKLSHIVGQMKITDPVPEADPVPAAEETPAEPGSAFPDGIAAILEKLRSAAGEQKWLSPEAFMPMLTEALAGVVTDKKLLDKIADGLSVMDKEAVIQRETKGRNKGAVIYDKASKDTEIVRWDETIEDYMAREVLPHVPDAQWFWEENVGAKKPVIKTGAEIPFTRYFYKYQTPEEPEDVLAEVLALDAQADAGLKALMDGE